MYVSYRRLLTLLRADRRGTPCQIISGNLKTFRAVEIGEIRDFKRFVRIQTVRVYFRKATSGGGESCEQLGAVIKNCLKKVVGKAKLSFEELNTVIVEIEKCVNSRPSTYLSEKHEDTVITPNHHGRDIDKKRYSSTQT